MEGPFKMKGSSALGYGNQHSSSKKAMAKMYDAPTKKALVGNQANLPEHLQAKIAAAPGQYASPAKDKGDHKHDASGKNVKPKVTKTYNKDGGYTKSDGKTSTTYNPNPDYKKDSSRTGNYKYITGEKDADGSNIGSNN
mgnify:CR=1 FL=1